MKKDIESTADIERLVNVFYEKVRTDPSISSFFTQTDWDRHLPLMYQFWENAIFYSGGYNGNPLQTHKHINAMMPMQKEHFARWVTLFISTVDEFFAGEKANTAKSRAMSISEVMQFRIC